MPPPPPTTPPPTPLDAAVTRALSLLDALTVADEAGHVERLRSADIDAAAAVCFLESWRAGAGLVVGGGKGFVMAKLPGKRGWWSAPLAVRATHLALGASAGARTTTALLTLDAPALARLMAPGAPSLRISPGAALAISCPCTGGAASRDDSFEVGLAAADYRLPGPKGMMVDYSVGLTLLARGAAGASAALLGEEGGEGGGAIPAGAAILGGSVPTPAALRPLCRALNAAACLTDRPAAPWPGV